MSAAAVSHDPIRPVLPFLRPGNTHDSFLLQGPRIAESLIPGTAYTAG
jgi:hypothetical protein